MEKNWEGESEEYQEEDNQDTGLFTLGNKKLKDKEREEGVINLEVDNEEDYDSIEGDIEDELDDIDDLEYDEEEDDIEDIEDEESVEKFTIYSDEEEEIDDNDEDEEDYEEELIYSDGGDENEEENLKTKKSKKDILNNDDIEKNYQPLSRILTYEDFLKYNINEK